MSGEQGIGEIQLYHGLKLTCSTPLADKFPEICYCKETQEYLVPESGKTVHRYSMQGKPIRPSYEISSTMLFTRMLWCEGSGALVCWIPNDDTIWLLDSFCKLLQILRNEFRIQEIFFSSIGNEIIVVGSNKITTYPMHDTGHPPSSLETINYLDSSFGSSWRIQHSSLIEGSSGSAVTASYLTSIYVMSLKSERETEGSSQFVHKNLGATRAAVTALFYHGTSEWIITGDQQGNVAGWNLKLECTMSCPNGRESQVQLITRHPSICAFIAISIDGALQVWSCNLREKMESFGGIGEIRRIAVNDSLASLATLGSQIHCFRMLRLYVFYAPLTAPSAKLYSTRNPTFPTRVIVACSDNIVAILSSRTGRRTNVQILSPKLAVTAATYSGITNRMYTMILKTGEILVGDAATKPIRLRHVWVNDDQDAITCIVAHESFEKIRGKDETGRWAFEPVSTLIVVGTMSGKLMTIEETSGKRVNVVDAAHRGPIVDLCSSIHCRQVVSVGADKRVKIWRVYPDIPRALILLDTVHHTLPITRVASLRTTICMLERDDRSKHHRIIMYDASDRIRLDQDRSKRHAELITDIATLETLEICASSSYDGTVRVWNRLNEIVKILEINTVARNIAFSSLRGDIVFGAGKHLYKIPHENYLSPEYRNRILAEEIPEEIEDEVMTESVDYRIYEDQVDRENVLRPVTSTPFGSLDTRLADPPNLENIFSEQIALDRRYRQEDILGIKRGKIGARRLLGDRSTMGNEAREKQMAELLGSSRGERTGALVPTAPQISNSLDETISVVKKHNNEPETYRMIRGYSVSSLDNRTNVLRETVKMPLFGPLANSLIYKVRREEQPRGETEAPALEKRTFKYRYPPEILSGDRRVDSVTSLRNDPSLTFSQLENSSIAGDETIGESTALQE